MSKLTVYFPVSEHTSSFYCHTHKHTYTNCNLLITFILFMIALEKKKKGVWGG